MTSKRKCRSLPTSLNIHSDAHPDKKCTQCKLCGESSSRYTHPITWKNEDLVILLRKVEPHIEQDSCICRNCRESLRTGLNTTDFHPRWHKQTTSSTECQVEGCMVKACRSTKLASHAEILTLLKLELKPSCTSDNTTTYLCDSHYRSLHKEIKPQSYRNKCVTCGVTIRELTHIRHYPNPDRIQMHLQQHVGFEGTITSKDRVCETCYRSHLTLLKAMEDSSVSDGEDLGALVSKLQGTIPSLPVTITTEDELISLAAKITIIKVAQELLTNHALTLNSAYKIFTVQVQTPLPMSSVTSSSELVSNRWLLKSTVSFSWASHCVYLQSKETWCDTI